MGKAQRIGVRVYTHSHTQVMVTRYTADEAYRMQEQLARDDLDKRMQENERNAEAMVTRCTDPDYTEMEHIEKIGT